MTLWVASGCDPDEVNMCSGQAKQLVQRDLLFEIVGGRIWKPSRHRVGIKRELEVAAASGPRKVIMRETPKTVYLYS